MIFFLFLRVFSVFLLLGLIYIYTVSPQPTQTPKHTQPNTNSKFNFRFSFSCFLCFLKQANIWSLSFSWPTKISIASCYYFPHVQIARLDFLKCVLDFAMRRVRTHLVSLAILCSLHCSRFASICLWLVLMNAEFDFFFLSSMALPSVGQNCLRGGADGANFL